MGTGQRGCRDPRPRWPVPALVSSPQFTLLTEDQIHGRVFREGAPVSRPSGPTVEVGIDILRGLALDVRRSDAGMRAIRVNYASIFHADARGATVPPHDRPGRRAGPASDAGSRTPVLQCAA